jgi:protein arginine N-methyltransferase 1
MAGEYAAQVAAMSEYNIHDHGLMIRDSVRMDAYARALERVVKADSVVLDIGTGTGIFSLLAARAGARQVFAVEPASVIELARELATANGLADRITFIRALSSRITLPEPADVIVSDLRGALPLYRTHVPSIVDSRRRHLARGGTLIPRRDALWAAPAELASVYETRVSVWETRPFGFETAGARALAANDWRRVSAPAEALLAPAATLSTLDYRSITSPNVRSSVEFEAARCGTLHGVLVWFDSELAEGVAFTNAPGEPETIYGQGFLPLLDPVGLMPGDAVSFAFSASLVEDDYIFRWDTRVVAATDPSCVKAAFTQSTLFASPLLPDILARAEESHVATCNEEGEAVAFVLARADGRATLGDLSQQVQAAFPELLRSPAEALRFVTGVSQKYFR